MIYLDLFWTFFKIGLFTFGGGYAMVPLIQSEVAAHAWMTVEEMINFIAVSESTPGPFAVNISTYVGRVTAGIPGAACATLGVILPSVIIILIVAGMYEKFKASRLVSGAMTGLRPVVIGLIGAALVTLGRNVLFPDGLVFTVRFWVSAAIFVCMAVLGFRFKKLHPIALIGLSAALGLAAGYALAL